MNRFFKPCFTLEDEAKSGPGPLCAHETYISTSRAPTPILSYAKSKGSLKDLYMDGLVVTERADENESFYSESITAARILTGELRYPTKELKALMETLKISQGMTDITERLIPTQPSPGDCQISQEDGPVFGVPDFHDPDPFGVVELENVGIAIKEAGTHRRASSEQFHFKPKVTSPIYGAFRKSMDSRCHNRQLSWANSHTSLDRRISVTDSATQTDLEGPSTPRAFSPKSSIDITSYNGSTAMANIPENVSTEPETETETTIDFTPINYESSISSSPSPVSEKSEAITTKSEPASALASVPVPASASTTETKSPPSSMSVEDLNQLRMQLNQIKTFGSKLTTSEPAKISIPKADEVAREEVATPVSIPKARLVTVAKRVPPKLPARNPHRANRRPSTNTLDSTDHERSERADRSTARGSHDVSPKSSSPTRKPELMSDKLSVHSASESPPVREVQTGYDDSGNPWN